MLYINGIYLQAQELGLKSNTSSGKNRVLLVSSPDRHIFLMGTETTIGTPGSQDDLFLRFSSQENFQAWDPSSTNTAGSFRIQDGSKIVAAKDLGFYSCLDRYSTTLT